ncbi:MAG: acetyl-CoA carboxylase biotin carboxyl carrier protein subunit [Candidatus Limnocylindria bacterium]
MTDYQVRVAGARVAASDGWRLEIVDARLGIGRLVNGLESLPVLVEGDGSEWVVTLRGRRIPVTVRSWRERILADAESTAGAQVGPIAVKATLPGLIVAVAVSAGEEVPEGAPLLTIEAMKMQNEVRAPRAGRVIDVTVEAGQVVATGSPLLRLE